MIAGVDRAERFVARAAEGGAPAWSRSRAISPASTRASRGSRRSCAARWRKRRRRGPSVAAHRARASRQPRRARALARADAAALASAGPLTPDHVIRTKGPALFLADLADDDGLARPARRRGARLSRARTTRYVDANASRARTRDRPARPVPARRARSRHRHPRRRTHQERRADRRRHRRAHGRGEGRRQHDRPLHGARRTATSSTWSTGASSRRSSARRRTPPLAGQVALVTGGAGAIGVGIARQLVAAGAHVVLADLDQRAGRRRRRATSIPSGRGPPPAWRWT